MIDITLVAPHAADIESASKTEISILARPNTTTKRQQMHKIEIKQKRYVQIVTGIQSSISRHVINQWTNRIEISDCAEAVHLGANSGYPSFLEQHGIHTSRSNSSEISLVKQINWAPNLHQLVRRYFSVENSGTNEGILCCNIIIVPRWKLSLFPGRERMKFFDVAPNKSCISYQSNCARQDSQRQHAMKRVLSAKNVSF